MSIFDKIKSVGKMFTDNLDDVVGKYVADTDFLEGAMAACAMIAASDEDGVEASEKAKTAAFLRTHPTMKHFGIGKATGLFSKFAGEFDFDYEMGCDSCLKEISEVRGDEAKRTVVARLALAIAKSDADFGAQEKVAARRIVEALRLNPADFGL